MLNGKTAIITGASRGIGRAVAIKMAEYGADIAIVYCGREDAALDVCARIAALGRKAQAFQCDVSDYSSCAQTVEKIFRHFGGFDILVNNAGITADKLVFQMSERDFDRVLDVNLKGAFNMIRHAYGHFLKRRGGRIINISSVAGLAGNAGQANYASSKAGLIGLTKSVAKELASRSVTCNAIAPGFIETDMTECLAQGVREGALASIPMKRTGRAEEVAQLAAFLASDLSGYITGEVIRVDGGMCM